MTTITQTQVVTVINAAVINDLIAQAIAADNKLNTAQGAHGKTYAMLASKLRGTITSGLVSTAQFTEYRRCVNAFAEGVASARMTDYAGDDKVEATKRHIAAINKGIDRDNKKAAWVAPKAEKSEEEKDVAKRDNEAKRKATDRAINKQVATLKKTHPKTDDKELRTMAKELVKEITAEHREASKDAANEQRYIEKLAAFIAQMPEVFVADVKEAQLRGAALIATLKALQVKA